MTTGPILTLRERLRVDTRHAHDSVDRTFAAFDLTWDEGLRPFLSAHRTAFAAMRDVALDDGLAADLDAALVALDGDLEVLGGPVDVEAPDPPDGDSLLARRYLWLGSRLGTRMLARKWREGAIGTASEAGRYFGTVTPSGPWRALCDELDGMSARGPVADATVAEANDWFGMFETVAHRHARAI